MKLVSYIRRGQKAMVRWWADEERRPSRAAILLRGSPDASGVPPTLRADQDPPHAKPRLGRVEAGRGDPFGARARGALSREPGHRAQGDRRARGGAHPAAPP